MLLGETSKFVPISRVRVRAVTATEDEGGGAEIRVSVAGAAGEVVTLGFFNASAATPRPQYLSCAVREALGTVEMHLVARRCV